MATPSLSFDKTMPVVSYSSPGEPYWLPLSGGTVTGNLTVSKLASLNNLTVSGTTTLATPVTSGLINGALVSPDTRVGFVSNTALTRGTNMALTVTGTLPTIVPDATYRVYIRSIVVKNSGTPILLENIGYGVSITATLPTNLNQCGAGNMVCPAMSVAGTSGFFTQVFVVKAPSTGTNSWFFTALLIGSTGDSLYSTSLPDIYIQRIS